MRCCGWWARCTQWIIGGPWWGRQMLSVDFARNFFRRTSQGRLFSVRSLDEWFIRDWIPVRSDTFHRRTSCSWKKRSSRTYQYYIGKKLRVRLVTSQERETVDIDTSSLDWSIIVNANNITSIAVFASKQPCFVHYHLDQLRYFETECKSDSRKVLKGSLPLRVFSKLMRVPSPHVFTMEWLSRWPFWRPFTSWYLIPWRMGNSTRPLVCYLRQTLQLIRGLVSTMSLQTTFPRSPRHCWDLLELQMLDLPWLPCWACPRLLFPVREASKASLRVYGIQRRIRNQHFKSREKICRNTW